MLFLHAVFSGSNAAFSYSLENNLRTLIFTTNSYNRFTRPEVQVAVTAELNLLTLTSLVSQLEFFFDGTFSNLHLHFIYTITLIIYDLTHFTVLFRPQSIKDQMMSVAGYFTLVSTKICH